MNECIEQQELWFDGELIEGIGDREAGGAREAELVDTLGRLNADAKRHRVTPDQPITSLPFSIGFDPKLIEVTAVNEGDFMRQGGASSSFTTKIDTGTGRVFGTATRGVEIPLVLMGYYNPMLAYGLDKFICDAIDPGVDGFIIPDLPLEESAEFISTLVGTGGRPSLPLIQMLAPTTPNERMEMIAKNAKGFIYLVSVTGVTGERKSISEGLGDLIARVRAHTSVPVCVGFGISTPEQARQVGALADGVIVGSACVKAIGESENPVEAAREFAKSFREALT